MNVNSFGGTDLHQDLLDQYILAMARGMHPTAEGLQSPRLSELLTAISTIVVPYSDPRIDALAQGREGVSDGKVWFVQQDVLVEKAQQATVDAEALAWFEESLREVLTIAQGGQGQHIRAIPSQDLADALAPWLDRDRPEWRELMGYDHARLQEKPALHALQIWQEQGALGFAGNERVLLTGDYNQHAQEILAALWSTDVPAVVSDPNSEEPYKAFRKAFEASARLNEVHSNALHSIAYLGAASRYLGVLSLPEAVLLDITLKGFVEVTEKEGISYTSEQKRALTNVLATPQNPVPYLKSPLVVPFEEEASPKVIEQVKAFALDVPRSKPRAPRP